MPCNAAGLLDVVHHLPGPFGVLGGVEDALLMVFVIPVRREQVSGNHIYQQVVSQRMLGREVQNSNLVT